MILIPLFLTFAAAEPNPPVSSALKDLKYQSRVNAWTLYQTDDFSSATVALIYDASGNLLGTAVGEDIAVECAVVGRTCQYRTLGADGQSHEIKISETTASGTKDLTSVDQDLLLMNLGTNSHADWKQYQFDVKGDFLSSLMGDRALVGTRKYRFMIHELSGSTQYKDFRFKVGRQSSFSGIALDGASALYSFGNESLADSKLVGFYAGFGPDPITKDLNLDYMVLGPTLRFIPDFAAKSDVKLRVDADIRAEFYKGEMNRWTLFSMVNFTPIQKISFISQAQLELPWPGNDAAKLMSSRLSLDTYYRPDSKWFMSLGLLQYRIDRFLVEDAVRWTTDSGSAQASRVGESLDHSHRYRLEWRMAYRPFIWVQPFAKFRYERRTFDSNKLTENIPTEPLETPTPANDLSLLRRKDAHKTTGGFRLFFMDQRLELESSLAFNQRYRSKAWDANQTISWDSGGPWTADISAEAVFSDRRRYAGTTGDTGEPLSSSDYYMGLGFTYSFLSRLDAQIRYDFSYEDDSVIAQTVQAHSVFLRFDYTF